MQSQEFLEKNFLGFDKNTFLASCYFSQKQLTTLAQLGNADTTNMVTNFLGFETYDSLYELMNQRIKEVTMQSEELEKKLVTIDNDIWKNNEQQKNVKEQIEMFTKTECSLKDEQSKIVNQIVELNKMVSEIVIPTITTEEIDVSLLTLNSTKSEMSTKNKTLQETGHLKTQELRKSLNLEQTKLQTILQEQGKIDKEKTKIETTKRLTDQNISKHEAIIKSLEENKCSYCGTIINKEDIEKHLGEEMAEISLLKASFVDNTEELNKKLNILYDQEAQSQELIEHINKQINESDAEITELLSANNAEISILENKTGVLQKQKEVLIKEVTEANSRKVGLTQQIKQLEQRGVAIQLQLKNLEIDSKQLQLKELEENAVKILSQKDTIICDKNKLLENKEIYEFWANSFSNKGIRPLLLDRFVIEFNKIVEPYCYDVSNGEFIVQFTPTSETRSGLERNKLGLNVIYKDKIESFGKLSGGEETRVNLPLCLALNKWVSSKYGVKNGILGLLILDEVFAHTDEKFRDTVAELLNDEGRNKSIFVIDHSSVLSSYTNNIWNVVKENDITQIEVV